MLFLLRPFPFPIFLIIDMVHQGSHQESQGYHLEVRDSTTHIHKPSALAQAYILSWVACEVLHSRYWYVMVSILNLLANTCDVFFIVVILIYLKWYLMALNAAIFLLEKKINL